MSVYPGQTFTFSHGASTFRATIEHDADTGAPWESEEGRGPVRRTEDPRTKSPGEVVLHVGDRGCYSYVYDFAAAVHTARVDGWGPTLPGETEGQRAVRTVRADMEFLRGWCADDWCYVGVIVELLDEDGEARLDHQAALWGCESCGDYVESTVVFELAEEVLTLG